MTDREKARFPLKATKNVDKLNVIKMKFTPSYSIVLIFGKKKPKFNRG